MKNWVILIALVAVLFTCFLPSPALAGDEPPITPTSSLIKVKDYSKDSPYTEIYFDTSSGKYKALISQLPMVNSDGVKIQVGWVQIGKSFVALPNQFQCVITGTQISLTAINDQPSGAKKWDYVTWDPKLYIGGKEIKGGEPRLLAVDPINSNYSNNVIEWTYGDVIRRVRIIEGLFSERWIFASDPYGTVEIVHKAKGSLSLKLGYVHDSALSTIPCYVSGDTETVYASSFSGLIFPVEIGATENFSSNPHVETTSIDGYVDRSGQEQTWADLRVGAGTGSYDDVVYLGIALRNSLIATPAMFSQVMRADLLFNTAGLPDTAIISSVNMTIQQFAAPLIQVGTPEMNVFGSNPGNNTGLVPADFQELQNWWTVPYSTAKTFASFAAGVNSTYVLNAAGIASINVTGISKFSLMESKYDAGNTVPPTAAGSNKVSYLLPCSAESGSGKAPILEIIYTVPVVPTVVTEAAYDISYVSAHLAGNVTSTGGAPVTQRAFDWDIDSGVPYANSWISGGSFGTGPYDCDTQVFPICTKIYFQARAMNSVGWGNGTEGNFTTLCAVAPTVNTIGSSDVTCDYANLWGNITDTGGVDADTWGYDWGTAPGVYTDGFSISLGGYGNGTYGTSIYPAIYNTTYYYRFYAINSGGRGNGTEMSFTTPWCPPQCSTNLTVTQTGPSSATITWTQGLYATNTTLIVKEESPPTDQFDGWVVYAGGGTTTNMTGLNFDAKQYFFMAFGTNPAGNSTCLTSTNIGGAGMLLFGFLGFFGIAILMTYMTSRFRGVFWSIFSALIWFALASWIASGTITHMDPRNLAEPWALILMVLFFGASIAVLALFMDQENKYEMRTKKGSVSWSASGPRPLSGKKNYNDAYYARRAELREKLNRRRR